MSTNTLASTPQRRRRAPGAASAAHVTSPSATAAGPVAAVPHTTEMVRPTHVVADLTVATMNYSIVLRCKDKRVAYATKSGKRMRSVTFLSLRASPLAHPELALVRIDATMDARGNMGNSTAVNAFPNVSWRVTCFLCRSR
eukprot:3943964-Pyramimonas_sp.AAC.1